MPLRPDVNEMDHSYGNQNASLIIVEYGDYQCPHCRNAHRVVERLKKKYGNKLRFIFRNFPLIKIHPQAMLAAVATEAAARQEKFWEMHDILFANQDDLSDEFIIELAEKIDLEMNQFKDDIGDRSLQQKVEDDFESGIRSGVNATPTFFINGEKYNNGWEGDRIANYIDEHLAIK